MIATHSQALNANLKLLALIRGIVVSGQVLAILYFSLINNIGLILAPLISIVSFNALFAFGTWMRSMALRPVSSFEFFIQLCIDMLALGLLVYFSGGASNPFVSYLLVPIAIGASTLRWYFSITLALMGLLIYSLLLFYYVPVHALMSHGDMGSGLSLHLSGMWFNFVISALLIAIFIVRMARTISLQAEEISQQREQKQESDRLVSIATLAANTAHQLGTPINSISLLSDELMELNSDKDAKKLTQTLQGQVFRCKAILQNLVSTADKALVSGESTQAARIYFQEVIERWALLHPDSRVDFVSELNDDALILVNPALEPAIFNLLDNAAESGSDDIRLILHCDPSSITLKIIDQGKGIPDAVLKNLGKPFTSNKDGGLGIGLYLAMSTAESMGGEVDIKSSANGTEVHLSLPRSVGEN